MSYIRDNSDMEKSAYEKSYDDALEIWDRLENVTKEDPYRETERCPMHPYHFFELSKIRGFTTRNGSDYISYVTIWRGRYHN